MKEREYLKELGKKITDSSARKEIVNEYEAHIEDCKAAYRRLQSRINGIRDDGS